MKKTEIVTIVLGGALLAAAFCLVEWALIELTTEKVQVSRRDDSPVEIWPELFVEHFGACSCLDGYKLRKLEDPSCHYCFYKTDWPLMVKAIEARMQRLNFFAQRHAETGELPDSVVINVEASHGKPAQKFTYRLIEED